MVLKQLTITLIAMAIGSMAMAEGDAEAGKTTFADNCSRCHYEDDFAEEADSVLGPLLQAIFNKEIRHRAGFSGLTEEDVMNLTAYLAEQ